MLMLKVEDSSSRRMKFSGVLEEMTSEVSMEEDKLNVEMDKKFKREDYKTRSWIFKLICEEFGVQPVLDLFADAMKHQCEKYFDVQEDALQQAWPSEDVMWCNPPWSLWPELAL